MSTDTTLSPSVHIGDRVQWTVNGQDQFPEPRAVLSIEEYDGAMFVLVDGSLTGVPIEQVTLVHEEADRGTAKQDAKAATKPPEMPESNGSKYLETALKALELGLSPWPPKQDGSKAPHVELVEGEWTWGHRQDTPATEEQIRELYSNGRTGNGLVCGMGNLECFEFDHPETYKDFLEAAWSIGLNDLVEKVRRGYEETSPGGGIHWLYRCAEVRGNTKLAVRPSPDEPGKTQVLIETRGQGGFIITAPSNGKVHPSGGAYEIRMGGLEFMATLTAEERDQLWDLARTFDEQPEPEKENPWTAEQTRVKPKAPVTASDGSNFPETGKWPGDDLEEQCSWAEILEVHGWTHVSSRGGTDYWRRPGKDRGFSATTGHCKGLKVFSTSTPFDTNGTHTKFHAYAVLNHAGDWKAAVKALAQAGFGTWIDNDGTEKQNPPPKGWKRAGKGPSGQKQAQRDAEPVDYSAMSDADLGLIDMPSVVPRPVRELWRYRVARGEMTLMAGEGGLGKSQLLLWLAHACSLGLELPDKSGNAPVGRTIILSAEDSPETTIKPRLMAMGADLSKITLLKARVTIRRPEKEPLVHPVSLRDLDIWNAILDRRPDTTLFIVDPLPSYLGRGVNDHRNNEIREILEPFLDVVIRPRDIAMFANTHLNKSADAKTPAHRILGSVAYGNLARNVHFVARDPDEPKRRYFTQIKANNAPDDLPGIAFGIEKRMVQSDAGEIETAIPVFEKETVSVDVSALIGGGERRKRGPAPGRSEVFARWLFEILKQGDTTISYLITRARHEGHMAEDQEGKKASLSPLYNAKDRIPFVFPGWRVEDTTISETELKFNGKSVPGPFRKAWSLVNDATEENNSEILENSEVNNNTRVTSGRANSEISEISEAVPSSESQVPSSRNPGSQSKPMGSESSEFSEIFGDRPVSPELSHAIRWLSGMLTREPIPRESFLELGDRLLLISSDLDEASRRIGVIRTIQDGNELWSVS